MAVNGKKSKAKKLQMMLIMIILTMMLMEITMIMTGKGEVGKLFKTCVSCDEVGKVAYFWWNTF